ncbi:cyclic-di-AMP receptor [Chakrabartyella piscis]|uniref:cyclic-di-AMP receptor n=1 Tax=Chakrabartyella piscis TaxID=2918914 RepID=UPI002958DB1E|nr:cyclic-di-AMP receptor [Chakrabartyella piscis]
MKLIIAIIQDEDAGDVISNLNAEGLQVTRLSTKGGFLRAGNTTIMTGVDDEKVEFVLKVIEDNSKSRTQYATLPSSCGAMHGFILAPIEVKIGGATVFVLDVDQFHKF